MNSRMQNFVRKVYNLGTSVFLCFPVSFFYIEYPQIDKVFGHHWHRSCPKRLLFSL